MRVFMQWNSWTVPWYQVTAWHLNAWATRPFTVGVA